MRNTITGFIELLNAFDYGFEFKKLNSSGGLEIDGIHRSLQDPLK